jgi:hypothetical protein
VSKYAADDPEVLARVATMKTVALEAANRWTDNGALRRRPHAQARGLTDRRCCARRSVHDPVVDAP